MEFIGVDGNIEFEKLLIYKNDKAFLDGVNLAEFTNMYDLTQYDFLLLLKIYLRNNIKNFKGAYTIIRETDTYIPHDPIYKIRYNVEGYVSVDKKAYDDYKKKIFDFAYTRCNAIAGKSNSNYVIKEGNELQVQREMDKEYNTYTCFYRSSGKVWNYLESNIEIDREEQERMYNVLNMAAKREKVKVLKK